MRMMGRAWGRLRRLVDGIRLHSAKGDSLVLGERIMLYGFPMLSIHSGSRVEIGNDVVLCSRSQDTALAINHPVKISTLCEQARISIGASSGLSGATLVAASGITLGREVLLGANVIIIDTDFHPVAASNRRHSDDPSRVGVAPVHIGDNVFVGANVLILKGTRVGRDCVIGAGSVVHGVFPEKVILAGNPARIIGEVPA